MTTIRFTVFILILICPALSVAQTSKSRVRLNSDKPSVYVKFFKFGEREPDYVGESNERVWLKLHNNTRWPLKLQSHGVNAPVDNELGLFVSVEEVITRTNEFKIISSPYDDPLPPPPGSSSQQTAQNDVPAVATPREIVCSPPYRDGCHVCSSTKLLPGRALVFSVPREMLCDSRKIYVLYSYDWEEYGNEPEHRVYFYGSELPKNHLGR